MDRDYEIKHLWNLSCTKKNGWQQDNCPVVRGDYGDLENAWKKATRAKAEHQRDDLMKKVEAAINAQETFRNQQRAAEAFVPQPILISAFLNKKRYMDEVVLEGKKGKPTVNQRHCRTCGEVTAGPLFSLCPLHYGLAQARHL